MTRTNSVVLVFLTIWSGLLLAQTQKPSETHPPGKNPHLGNKTSIRSGLTLYRVRCGDCHGLDARGYRGPDLTAVLGGMPDERLFQTIRKGVPGTEMPPSTLPDDEVLMIIAYLTGHGRRGAGGDGDGQRRQRRPRVCRAVRDVPSCRRSAAGGWVPICRASAPRDRAAALVREIRTPSEWMPAGYETVTLVTEGRPEDSRAQEERGCLLYSGHGHTRAPSRISAVRPAGGDLREDLADAGVRTRSAERQRSQRSRGVSEHAAETARRSAVK